MGTEREEVERCGGGGERERFFFMRKIYDLTIQTNHSFSISNKPQNATLLQTIKAFTQVAMYKSFKAERKKFLFSSQMTEEN